jgi:large subunit ribosomal protein L11
LLLKAVFSSLFRLKLFSNTSFLLAKHMAKKVKQILKLNLPAGTATPAPPVGPILGQTGINMMQFIKDYNDRTKDQRGQVIPAEITIYEDRSFTFELKLPPVSAMIKQVLKIQSGSGEAGKKSVGKLTAQQVEEIATQKLPDLNTKDLEAAKRSVIGAARSMGVEVI